MASPRVGVGDYFWAKPLTQDEFEVPFGCRFMKQDGRGITVQDDDGKQSLIPFDSVLKNMHVTSIRGVEDMITLGDLQEYSILRNLHVRYLNQLIYTYTGSMLVAVNPYEILPIYTNEQIFLYQGKKLGEIPPHIFAIGDSCYRELLDNQKNQCIVISGESGAGKTESTKLILQYLAATSGKHSWIEQQIQETNPILESFGNAKTIRNDNSSRFGKYININFNKGAIDGAKIDQYLLEKTRIVSQSKGDRNYHIFYGIVAGLTTEERKRLELGNASSYAYLNGGQTLECEGRNEASEFSDVRAALKVLNFSDENIWDIFKLLAVILHFGNLKYKDTVINNIESAEVADSQNANRIASFLGVNKSALCYALTRKTIIAHGEKVVSPISKAAALESRDSFVKAIYGRMFIKIVDKINETIHKPNKSKLNSIGVLDIFGFENFTSNSFEQICINYANEHLQQFFVKHIFKMEQEQYAQEGIKWTNIEYIDNQEILDIIGMKPMNIMSLLDEESKFPQGNDLTFLSKINSQHGTKRVFVGPKATHVHKFQIQHFAGNVDYQISGFLDKNRDSFSLDIRELVKLSTNEFLRDIFSDVLKGVDDIKKTVTLSNQFKSSLDVLMKTLYSCHPYFVRCIKPNEVKKPKIFDRALCVRQLRYAGMMETARIRKAGYPIRHIFTDFVNRYRILVPNMPPAFKIDCKAASIKICEIVLPENSDFQIGHSRVFLKDFHDFALEESREKILKIYILRIQTNVRRWICRRRYLKMKAAALIIQKTWRARGYRKRYLIRKQGYLRLQAIVRSRILSYKLSIMKQAAIKVQAIAKGYVIRKVIRENKSFIKANLAQFRSIQSQEEQNLKAKDITDYKRKAEDARERRYKAMFRSILSGKSQLQPQLQKPEYKDTVREKKTSTGEDKYLDLDDVFGFLQDTDEGIREKRQDDFHNVNDNILEEQEDYEDLSSYDFRKFSATFFLGNVNHQYSRKPLKHSLLDLPTPIDIIAARALWVIILRFMGDLPEPKFDEQNKDSNPVMTMLSETLGRSFQKSKEYQQLFEKKKSYNRQNKMIHMTLKKSQKLDEELRAGMMGDDSHQMYNVWLNEKRSTNLEKLHFIIGHGVLRPELRDEIYCQLCKQLSNNPSKASHARGWILMSLCAGCFPPTQRFCKYLKSFIREGPPGYAPFCEGRLNRTIKNGPRTQPPSWLELQAAKSKEPISLTISFMDGSSRVVKADSASTAEEICGQIASNIGLGDVFGFSIFVNLFDKVLSLGSESEHIMDAISQCEQYAKEQDTPEKSAPWKLFFRKEIFTPWHNSAEDKIATDLIYHQIIRGVKFGEYRCNSENDVAVLAAHQYYIENGATMNEIEFHKDLSSYVPNQFMQSGEATLKKLEIAIIAAFKNSQNVNKKVSTLTCKEDIVYFAKLNWPIMFSRFFEAIRIKGPSIPKDNVIIAINWTGIYVVDEQEHILSELSYAEITYVGSSVDESDSNVGHITIITAQKEELVFQSLDALGISNLVIYIIEGLKKRSLYVIAQSDYREQGDTMSFLKFKKGDLITLLNDCNGETIMTSTWGHGESNGTQGLFPTNQVYILPTITKPTQQIIDLFKKDGATDVRYNAPLKYTTMQRNRMHTLQNYANDHFRPVYSNVSTVSRRSINSVKKKGTDDLWRHSREPIRMPLLEKLMISEHLCKEACSAFMAILKYMGDIPAPKAMVVTEFTDEIFYPAIKYEALRDEIYCQLMKQLTDNKNQLSEERGWELMWLATGLVACGQTLTKELTEFLKSRLHPIAKECLHRYFRTLKVGQRQCPPYIVEIEAIQHRSLEIYHKVYFPDDTDEAFGVDSSTKAKDLCEKISERLCLKNSDGFNLFVKVVDKVFSVPENYFFFDFVHELVEWMKESRPTKSGAAIQMQYQIFFMKKLWIHAVPGKDPNADQIFYFPQELPKYLRGYHKCNKADAIVLAALIYRALYGDDNSHFAQPSIIKQLVPVDLIKLQSAIEWKKLITAAYLKDKGKSQEKAKEDCLKIISTWPTFGTAFFEVKQTTLFNYPEIILIGINKNGVSLIHPITKDILVVHPFSELANWSSGHNYFHMSVGNFMKGSKILCETSLGYKMDDLISSYIAYMKTVLSKKH